MKKTPSFVLAVAAIAGCSASPGMTGTADLSADVPRRVDVSTDVLSA